MDVNHVQKENARMSSIPTAREVGWRLAVLADALNMSDRALAELLGISAQRLHNYISGRAMITPTMAMYVHMRTGATLDWLYRGDISSMPVGLATAVLEIMDRHGRRAG
jgi:transcriptional regulator with XRE-family HTH domain